ERFGAELFDGKSAAAAALPRIDAETGERVREHILGLYRRFRDQAAGGGTDGWEGPLLEFLKSAPPLD
ncbi:MAG: hypothetical protein LBH51_09900, partial [Treponema sp.]|nr:hypothetical protein [Treponema sp.]